MGTVLTAEAIREFRKCALAAIPFEDGYVVFDDDPTPETIARLEAAVARRILTDAGIPLIDPDE